MKSRELAALLRVLKQFGVTSYRAGDISVQFGDGALPMASAPEKEPEDLELPPGVIDPRAKLAEIYAKRGKRAA
jgi:hypothetical protein